MQYKVFNVPVESEESVDRGCKLNDFLGAINVKRVFASLANHPKGPIWSVLFFYEDGAQRKQQTPANLTATVEAGGALTREQIKTIMALKKWRADQAAVEGVPLYMVAQNKWLEEIVQMPGRTLDDLKRVRGLGEWRVQKYGTKIIDTLNAANAARQAWPASSHAPGPA